MFVVFFETLPLCWLIFSLLVTFACFKRTPSRHAICHASCCRVFDAEVAAIFDATVNFGKAMKEKFFRARNNNDIVPRIPPHPYKHVGKEIYFDR